MAYICQKIRKATSQLTTKCYCFSTDAKAISAWQIYKYGTTSELTLSTTRQLPVIDRPSDVLVKVHAASVNPIDILIMGGYGDQAMDAARRLDSKSCSDPQHFPLTLGRDFSGVVVDTGKAVNTLKPGDEVWGTVQPYASFGTHAQYTKSDISLLGKKPKSITHIEAASLPYVAMTSWAALVTAAGITKENGKDMRVLVLGGSGGIGNYAIQLLKCWGVDVTATCSKSATDLVTSLGANCVLNYDSENFMKNLKFLPGFDVVYDAIGNISSDDISDLLAPGGGSVYVTLVSPALSNIDKMGLIPGMVKNVMTVAANMIKGLPSGNHYRWAFYQPSVSALNTTAALVESKQLRPIIDKVYSFNEVPQAMDKVTSGHNRGKTVIDMTIE